MNRSGRFRSISMFGRACLAASLLAGTASAASGNPTQLLKQADSIKSAKNADFVGLLQTLDDERASLSRNERQYLDYLQAWQIAYRGDYANAIPHLESIIAETSDVTLRFRATVTVVNVLAISSRNEEAYTRLSQMLDLLPQVSDPDARQQGLMVAATLYSQVGQYDLAEGYADKVISEDWAGRGACKGGQLKLEAIYKAGRLETSQENLQKGIDACVKLGEPIWSNLIRVYQGKLDIAQKKYSDAIDLLKSNESDVERTHYPRLISTFNATLAQAYWKSGDTTQAQLFAQHAIDGAVKNEYTEALVDAYDVLYQIARTQGDYSSALTFHEKFAAADKGYLNDTSARTLAYQMVRQQVQEKRLQVEALSKQNQVLQLKQQVDAKTAEAGKLLILLLVTMGGSIAMYAFRTKRSQIKFMKLARRDGLTDIYNRQYFVEASDQELQYCQKSMRDVSVIVIDLDHFKQINDTHGHAAGDFALKRAVAMCQQHIRSVDVFGRLGGEEFGILMPDCVPERAADQAELMRISIERLVNSEDGPDFPVRASFGISAARWSGYDLRQLLAHADSALYQAKREGRNRVTVYAGTSAANTAPPPGLPDRRRTVSFSTGEDARR